MKPAPLDPLARRVLRALYELAELDCPAQPGLLGRALGIRAADVARVLLVLDARGLASADRARLTLLGLSFAARMPALSLASEPWLVAVRQALAARGETAGVDHARRARVSSLSSLRRCDGDSSLARGRTARFDRVPALARARRG